MICARGETLSPDPVGGPLRSRWQRATQTRLQRPCQRRRRIERKVLAAVGGLALVLAAGCSGGGGGTSVSGTITIAAAPGVQDAPLYLAQQRGLFEHAGLHVVIKSFGDGSSAAQLAAVESGQAQIAASDYGNIFARQAQHNNSSYLRILADGYDAGIGTAEILVRPRSTITSPAGLRFTKIGVPSDLNISAGVPSNLPTSLVAVAAAQSIKNYMLAQALSLRWESMSPQQEISQLQSGQLQAALLTQPYVYEAESRFGAVELMDVFGGETANLPLLGYVSRTSWASSNAAAVADFQAALSLAQSDAATVGPIQQTLHSAEGMSTAVADMVAVGTYPTATSSNELERVVRLMANVGLVSINSPSFLPDLLGR
jgi:NitT/TauT family transport system substrate-binding protein